MRRKNCHYTKRDMVYTVLRRCPQCKSTDTVANSGVRRRYNGSVMRWCVCRSCGKRFIEVSV